MNDIARKILLRDANATANQGAQLRGSTIINESVTQIKPIISDATKTKLNFGFNGTAAAFNFLTFLNGNLFHFEPLQETLEKASEVLTKLSTAVQGLINATIGIEKKNLIATIGGALEPPIAYFTNGFNLFLARGISAGMNQFQGIIIRTKKVKEDGTVELDNYGNEKYYENFSEEGWLEGVKITFQQFPKLIRELYTKPFNKEGIFPRSSFLCSSFMILGPIISFFVHEKLGAAIRDTFGGLEAIALATDKEPMKKNEKINLSNYAMSGIVWTLGAIADFLKRLSFFSEKIVNGTEISLCLDRIGAIFYVLGNQGKVDQKAVK